MAIKVLQLVCDHCTEETDGAYEDVVDALQGSGYILVQAADWVLGSDEKIYCSLDCLKADLL